MARYILSNTFTPVDKRVFNRIKYYLRSLDFMFIKSLPYVMYNSPFAKQLYRGNATYATHCTDYDDT